MATKRAYTAKDVERALLRVVYDTKQYSAVRHQEEPDFVLSPNGNGTGFGVEITEVYESESDARLQNIDGYMQELWDGKPHRHRDDIEVLKTGPITLRDKDGNVKATNLPVVMINTTNMPSLPSLLAQRIRRKETRFSEYVRGVTHVNLIIHDRTHGSAPKADEVYDSRVFLSDSVKSALNASKFSEVFVVSTDADNNQVYRSLRALVVLESGYGYLQSMREAISEPVDMHDDDIHVLFYETCRGLGLDVDFVRDEQARPYVYFGGVGIRFDPEGVRIYEVSNFPPPVACEPPSFEMRAERAESLIQTNVDFFADKAFSSAYGHPPVTSILETIRAASA
ncbi:hypothetical protein [Mycobacterium sp. 1245805.9]|uniref:hypothetical protein n=1 Tax=Mycobacterium sp. 1245805.9 TaxID=1856862 RepID=UPI0012EA5841|nr:hypothetical protein [Mycobacterium sp. 1245805.9]